MKKLCCIFNTPSLYRETIYKQIEYTYDCDWYFEDTDNHLKEFDTNQFKNVKRLKSYKCGPFYGVKGLLGTLFNKNYSDYLMMGHSRNISIFIFLIFKKIFFNSKKVFLWTHGFYGKENLFEYLWKKILLGLADELLIYGDYACHLMQEMGFKKTKLHPIHNSLNYNVQLELRNTIGLSDLYIRHFGNDAPVLIFIGRLNPIKRLDMLVNALKYFNKRGEIYNLVFIGDGPDSTRLKNIVRDSDLNDQVWFFGASYDEKINAELIINADLCIAPGNIGLTAIHALSFGCPAITHNNFAKQMPEFEVIKDSVTGTFFEYRNQQSLNRTIDNWFKQDGYCREQIRLNCYKEIDSNWNPNYQIKIIRSVIK